MVLVSVLYAEVYFICMIVVGLLLFWSLRSDSRSSSEQRTQTFTAGRDFFI